MARKKKQLRPEAAEAEAEGAPRAGREATAADEQPLQTQVAEAAEVEVDMGVEEAEPEVSSEQGCLWIHRGKADVEADMDVEEAEPEVSSEQGCLWIHTRIAWP